MRWSDDDTPPTTAGAPNIARVANPLRLAMPDRPVDVESTTRPINIGPAGPGGADAYILTRMSAKYSSSSA